MAITLINEHIGRNPTNSQHHGSDVERFFALVKNMSETKVAQFDAERTVELVC
jgi:hypothetical protein